MYILFSMVEGDGDSEFLMEVFCKMLGRIHTTMLSSRATEGKLKVGKSTVNVSLNMKISQLIHTFQERKNLSVLFKEINHRLVQPGLCTARQSNTYPPPFPLSSAGMPFL